MASVLLRVDRLSKSFPVASVFFGGQRRSIKAVDEVSFTVERGKTFGLVGESGSGKTTLGKLILRLIEPSHGHVYLDIGTDRPVDIHGIKRSDVQKIRQHMQMIFQDPYSSLNPRMRIGKQIAEPIKIHRVLTRHQTREEVLNLLDRVGLDPSLADRYPHQLSGGQRQRVCIARVLSLKPSLVVADEPVSALDVSVQAQIINLMKELQEEFLMSYLFIAHDIAVVRHISDRIGVMYLGRMVEIADRDELFHSPLHPYTNALLSAVPVPNPRIPRQKVRLKGEIPSPLDPPSGCPFHPRCPMARPECAERRQELKDVGSNHLVACHVVTE